MALRVKAIPYVYNSEHDINDVIRQYNSLSPNHSKVSRLRDEFNKTNTPPFSQGDVLQIPVLTVSLGPHTSGKFKLDSVVGAITPITQEKPTEPQKPQKIESQSTEIPPHLRPEFQYNNIVGSGTPLTPDKKDIRLLGGIQIRPGAVLRNGCLFKIVDLRDDIPVQSEVMLKQDNQ